MAYDWREELALEHYSIRWDGAFDFSHHRVSAQAAGRSNDLEKARVAEGAMEDGGSR